MTTDLCLHCSCPATVQVITGEELCAWHYDQAPHVVGCPNCQPIAERDAGSVPVAADDDRSSDAPAGAPPPAGAAIARAGEPAAPARVPLDDLLLALRGCVQFCEDEWRPLDPPDTAQIDRALLGLSVLRDAITALAGYRSLGCVVADEPGWYVITSWVPAAVVDMATDVLQRVKP